MTTGERLPTLDAGRVSLRWLDRDDAEALFEIFSDPEVTRYWSWTAWTDRADAQRLIEDIHAHFRRGDLLQWGITRSTDDRIIGTATLANIDRPNHRAEIGFALGRAYWGQGHASTALHRLIEHAFEQIGLHRLEADVDPNNAASIATLEHLGFRREGHMRERWYAGGTYHDSVFYGLLHHEWLAVRA